jgi:hypothetical protein
MSANDPASAEAAGYQIERRRRRSSSPGSAAPNGSRARQRVRAIYFVLATLWGFAMGSAAMLAASASAGRAVQLDQPAAVALALGLVVALGGGVLASRAYRETSQRFR